VYQPLLEVDLTEGTWRAADVPDHVRKKWIGGTGLGLHLLSESLRPGMRATDPDCPVFVLTGPLTGTAVPQSSDTTILTLNADYTHNICASHCHGHFAARLRHAGWDGVILRGQSEKPVYLWIDDNGVELRPADEVWGMDTFDTPRVISGGREGVSVACIGPAGENLVSGASVRTDLVHSAAQGGAGVAWGAKKLKAIATSGTKPVALADPERFLKIAEEWEAILDAMPGFPEGSHAFGLRGMPGFAERGLVMGKNFTDTDIALRWGEKLEAELEKWRVEEVGSWNCKAKCHFRATCTTGPMQGLTFGGYGGEVMEEVGPNLGIDDPSISFMLGGVVDGYGLGALGPPHTIAMLMEAFNEGDIGLEETDGIDLTWGNYEGVLELLERTMRREGIGDLIAQGMRPAAQALGIEGRAVHMHGGGFNNHDQRARPYLIFQSQVASGAGPSWQTNAILGTEGGWGIPSVDPDLGYEEEHDAKKTDFFAEVAHRGQQIKMWDDCIGVCYFATLGIGGTHRLATEAVEAATGVTLETSTVAADRIINLQRLINLSLGFHPDEDFDLSSRLLGKLTKGPAKGYGVTKEELQSARDEYYERLGWSTETGAPWSHVLERLDLQTAASRLGVVPSDATADAGEAAIW